MSPCAGFDRAELIFFMEEKYGVMFWISAGKSIDQGVF